MAPRLHESHRDPRPHSRPHIYCRQRAVMLPRRVCACQAEYRRPGHNCGRRHYCLPPPLPNFSVVLSRLFFPESDVYARYVGVYGIFAAGFFTRPLGALLFGWIGDAVSRKAALLASIYGMAVPTFLMGCLPTYEQVWTQMCGGGGGWDGGAIATHCDSTQSAQHPHTLPFIHPHSHTSTYAHTLGRQTSSAALWMLLRLMRLSTFFTPPPPHTPRRQASLRP
eukprot:362013-Chlamydomonas_euryale.AAC.3